MAEMFLVSFLGCSQSDSDLGLRLGETGACFGREGGGTSRQCLVICDRNQ